MADLLLGEIDSALRQDKLYRFIHRYRKHALYAALALIVFTVISTIWGNYREDRAQFAMEQFTYAREAFAKGDYTKASKGFHDLVANTNGELNDLARLWEARTLAAENKNSEAAVLFTALAEHPQGSELIWRDLACLRLVGIAGIALPKACADKGDSPLKPQRDELRAAALMEEGKIEEAKNLLTTIAANERASTTARARAQSLLATLKQEKAK